MFSISSSNWCWERLLVPYASSCQNSTCETFPAITPPGCRRNRGGPPTTSCNSHLEGQVLQEVSSSVGSISLGSASGIDKDTDSGGLGVWRVLGSDLGVNGIASALNSSGSWQSGAYGQSILEGCRLGGAVGCGGRGECASKFSRDSGPSELGGEGGPGDASGGHCIGNEGWAGVGGGGCWWLWIGGRRYGETMRPENSRCLKEPAVLRTVLLGVVMGTGGR